jgi:hypothetical protein
MERPGINWGELHSGHITQREILVCVNDEQWQLFRESLRGEALDEKFIRLKYWLRAHRGEYPAKVQVTNYVNALARGGLISPVNKTD